jgi:hypothetical protein
MTVCRRTVDPHDRLALHAALHAAVRTVHEARPDIQKYRMLRQA